MGISLAARDASGALVATNAIACGYPDDADWDVAVVVLPAPVAEHHLPLCDPRPQKGAQFDATVFGFLPSSSAETDVERRIRRRGRQLLYQDAPALLGMSGGPVLKDGQVAGVQSFDHHGSGRAIVLDFDVLNECREAALSG